VTPWWFQLLKALRQETRIAREGSPTLGFLVGAMQSDLALNHLAEDQARASLSELITSLVTEMPPNELVHITRCSVLHEPVVRPSGPHLAPYYKHGLESNSQQRRTVLLDEEFADQTSASIDFVTDRLFRELKPNLCAGRFSFAGQGYRPFDAYEQDFILGVLGR